jgi:hypothetical protein
MRKKFITAVLAVVLAVLGLGLAGAGPAQAADSSVSNADGAATAHVNNPGYYGSIKAKPTACVVMERKTSAGNWVRSGFWQGQFQVSEMRVCYDNVPDHEDWEIPSGLYVFGLRMVSNQGLTATLCTSKPDCNNL